MKSEFEDFINSLIYSFILNIILSTCVFKFRVHLAHIDNENLLKLCRLTRFSTTTSRIRIEPKNLVLLPSNNPVEKMKMDELHSYHSFIHS